MEAVGPARDTLDACLIFPSMPAVMKLNKLGTFSMSQLGGGGKSAIGERPALPPALCPARRLPWGCPGAVLNALWLVSGCAWAAPTSV